MDPRSWSKTTELTYEAADYYLPQKRASFFAFFYKIRANAQQVFPVQTGLYRYDEWMLQDIYDNNLNVSWRNLTEVNLVC